MSEQCVRVSGFDDEYEDMGMDMLSERKNQALDAIAAQSSISSSIQASKLVYHNPPELAIDGIDDVILAHHSCSVTLEQDDPWWMITFNYVVRLDKVTITTATDAGKLRNDDDDDVSFILCMLFM